MRIRSKEIRRSRKRDAERILDKVKAARAARPVKPVRPTRPASGGSAPRTAVAPRQRPPRAAAPAATAPETPSAG